MKDCGRKFAGELAKVDEGFFSTLFRADDQWLATEVTDETPKPGSHKKILDTVIYGVQGFLPQIISLLLLPVLTRVLTKEDYGIINLVTTFSAILAGFVAFQLPGAIGRFFLEYEDRHLPRFFSSLLAASCVIGVVVLAVLFSMGDFVTRICFPKSQLEFHPYFSLASLTTFLGVITKACSLMLQVQLRSIALLYCSIISAVFQAISSVLLVVVFQWGPLGVIVSATMGALIHSTLLLFAVRNYLAFELDLSLVRSGLFYSLPLIPHVFGAFLYTTSDVLVLERYTDLAAVGIYGLAVRLSSAMRIGVDAFNRADAPRFMKRSSISKAATTEEYASVITKWTAVALTAWVGISLFAREVLSVLIPPAFLGVSVFIPIIAAAYLFRGWYCFAVQTLFFEKRTKWIPLITLSSGVVNVGLNLVIIPHVGAIGAAWTTLVSFAMAFAFALKLSNSIYPLRWNAPLLLCMVALAVPVVVVSEVFSSNLQLAVRVPLKIFSMLLVASVILHLGGVVRRGGAEALRRLA